MNTKAQKQMVGVFFIRAIRICHSEMSSPVGSKIIKLTGVTAIRYG